MAGFRRAGAAVGMALFDGVSFAWCGQRFGRRRRGWAVGVAMGKVLVGDGRLSCGGAARGCGGGPVGARRLRNAAAWAKLRATLASLGLAQVVRSCSVVFPLRGEQRPGKCWCRWSAVVRWDGQCVGRPGVVGPELSGGFGLTPRSADAAAPRANVGGISA